MTRPGSLNQSLSNVRGFIGGPSQQVQLISNATPSKSRADSLQLASLSASLNLSGLSSEQPRNLSPSSNEDPFEVIYDLADADIPKKRLVLVVPRSALPQKRIQKPASASFQPTLAGDNPSYVLPERITLTSYRTESY
jgi:hypothetical protein